MTRVFASCELGGNVGVSEGIMRSPEAKAGRKKSPLTTVRVGRLFPRIHPCPPWACRERISLFLNELSASH